MAEEFVEGWTERINYTIYADGEPQVLTGMTVTLLLYDKHNLPVDYDGTAGIENEATGLLYFDPASTDLLKSKSPYYARWVVTDSGGQVAPFPSGPIERWIVRKP